MAAEGFATDPRSELTAYARRVPASVLKGHVIMGAMQITAGCLLLFLATYGILSRDQSASTNTFSGFWSAFFFICAGATGLAGGRGRANTQCCIVSCLVLSILAACIGSSAIIVNSFMAYASSFQCMTQSWWCVRFMPSDILWFLLYFAELVVAIVQAAFACRASCCFVEEADDRRVLTDFSANSPQAVQPPVYAPPSYPPGLA